MLRHLGFVLTSLAFTTVLSESAYSRPQKLPVAEQLPIPETVADAASRSAVGTQTLNYGYFELIDDEPFAIVGETWTFDHGGEPLEGWRSRDLTSGGTMDAFRRITSEEWNTNNPGVSAPIPSGSGAAWAGLYQTEADAAGWSGGLGYGHSWCHRFTSPELTHSGSGDVEFSFDYFNNTEDDFDFSKVYLRLEDGTEVLLASFTGTMGNPASDSYVAYDRTISLAEFQGQTGFRFVFEVESDGSFDDEDGFYNTTFGPFAADNIEVIGNVVEGDQTWDFEGSDHGFLASQCGVVGDFFGAADASTYGIGCDALSGFVAEMHSDDLYHPNGQWAYLYSPAVDISTIQPDTVYLAFDSYFDLPREDGVYYRVGWEYYPTTPGGSEWSDRVGDLTWFFTGDDPYCGPVEDLLHRLPDDIPASTEWIRAVFELRSDPEAFGLPPCTIEPCNGNLSPLLDNIVIKVQVPSSLGSIAGNVFEDAEGDCSADSGGEIFTRFVRLEPGGKIATVRDDGDFLFEFLEPGNYDLTLLDKPHWDQTCPGGTSQDLTLASGEAAIGIDFGTSPVANVIDVSTVIGASQARPGFPYSYRAEVRNIGTTGTDSVDVVVTLPANVSYDSATDDGVFLPSGGEAGTSIGTVSWRLGALAPESSRGLGVKLTVQTDAPLGSALDAAVTASAPDDVDGSNDSAIDATVIVGSYDPNDKHVLPDGEIVADQLLAYHINFQNVGTASAINIVVRDTLDANLDIATVVIGATSHDYVLDIVGRELIWSFQGIELPDSSSNEPESHGWVEFTALPVSGLSPGAEIVNRAGIYFDFNEVVLTNTVISTIADPASSVPDEPTRETSSLQWRSIAPNPSSESTVLRLAALESGTLTCSVYAVDGRRVRNIGARAIAVGTTDVVWDGRSDVGNPVPGGLYFVRVAFDGDAGSRTELEARIVRIE